MPEPTRIEQGRRRAQVAKRAAAFTATAGFAVVLALVRQGHPATASHPTRTSTSQSWSAPSSSTQRDDSTLGGGSIAPSSGGSAPLATATS